DRYLRDRMPGAALSWANRAMYFRRDPSTAHLIAATALAEMGRKTQALLEARTYYRASAGRLEAIQSLARFYPEIDDLRLAVDDSGRGLLSLADYFASRKREGDAARSAELASVASPEDAQVHVRAAGILTASGQVDEAEHEAQRAVELAPDQPGGYLALAAARSAEGDSDGARQALANGLRAQPGQDSLVLALVQLHLAQGHPELAEQALKDLGPQISGDQRAQLFGLQGQIYARQGRTVKAEEAYRNALRLAPSAGYGWNLVALLENQSKLAAAQEVLQELRASAGEDQRAFIDKRIAQEQARMRELETKATAR